MPYVSVDARLIGGVRFMGDVGSRAQAEGVLSVDFVTVLAAV